MSRVLAEQSAYLPLFCIWLEVSLLRVFSCVLRRQKLFVPRGTPRLNPRMSHCRLQWLEYQLLDN